MTDPTWKQARGVLMTSEHIPAYGGLSFPPEFLEAAAERIRSGSLPMHADHHLSQPIRTQNQDAKVVSRADGIHELRYSFEIHEDDVHLIDSRSGMSATVMTPLERGNDYVEPIDPKVELSADHAWFPDEFLLQAEAALISGGIPERLVKTERAYQFSFTPDPQIFLAIELGLLTSIAGNAIWAAVARLFRGRRTPEGGKPTQPTIINLTITEGARSVTAIVQTDSEEIAARALDRLDTIGSLLREAPEGIEPVVSWDDDSRQWVPPN